MLDKLLEDLKKKLPGAKKSEDQEDQEEQEASSDENEESADEADEESSGKKEDTKKKSSPIIKIVIILAIGYLAFDFLMPTDDSTDVDQLVQVPVPKKKKLKKDREKQANESVAENKDVSNPAETPSEVAKPLEGGSEVAATATTEVKTDEAVIENKKEDELSNAISDISVETKENKNTTTNTSNDLTKAPVEEINVLKNPNTNDSKIDDIKVSEFKEETINGLGEGTDTKKETVASSLESKISEPSVYVDPPKYEVFGRGLVYNCKGKHWACVDKSNYQICYKNMKFNSENGKTSECVTQNVYANEEDCSTVQRYNVSTNVSTAFCK